MRGYFSILISLTFATLTAQTLDYSGLLMLPDTTFITYKIELEESEGLLKGFSYTDLNGPHESKSTVVGRYNKRERQVEFREVDLVYTKSPITELDFCYVYFKGKLRNLKGQAKIEGNFKSYYDDLEPCINGQITLQDNEKTERRTEKIQNIIQDSKKVADSVKTAMANNRFLNTSKRQGLKGGEKLNVIWESSYATLEIWDPGKVDGDLMSIKLNDEVIHAEYAPLKTKTKIHLSLNKEINNLTLEALSEGTDPPNTAQIRLTDDKGKEISMLSSFKVGEKVDIVFYPKPLK